MIWETEVTCCSILTRFISPRDPRLLHVVDTVDEAVDCVVAEAWRLRNGDDAGSGAPGAR